MRVDGLFLAYSIKKIYYIFVNNCLLNMLRKQNFYILIIFLLGQFLYAQNDKPLRIEISTELSSNYYIIPLSYNGVLLLYKGQKIKNKNYNKWYAEFYNTNFEHQWKKEIELPSDQ